MYARGASSWSCTFRWRARSRCASRCTEPVGELAQVASLGLVKAIARFNPARDLAFSSYAVAAICGDLERYMRDDTRAVRSPRSSGSARCASTASRTRSPPTSGAPRRWRARRRGRGLDEEELLKVVHARSARGALSLAMLGDVPAALSPREREILRLRFVEDRPPAEIGAIVGIGWMQVSRIVRQALQRLHSVAEVQASERPGRPRSPPRGRSGGQAPTWQSSSIPSASGTSTAAE